MTPSAHINKIIHGRLAKELGVWFWLGLLYLGGLAAWYYFLNGGAIPFEYHDWAQITAPRLAFLKDAVSKGELPLHMPGPWALRNVTDRYLALPDTPLSPQVLALKWLEVGPFIVFNTCLFFSLGFLGILLLRREYALSLPSTTALVGLMLFNGNVVSHISVGHANWVGSFLLPFVVYLLLGMFHGHLNWPWIGWWSFLMFVILLQGAFHLFVATSLFLLAVMVFASGLRRKLFLALTFSGLLGALRLVPPILDAGKQDTEFLSGFSTLKELSDAFIELRSLQHAAIISPSPLSPLGWWEIDYFVGLVGAAAIAYFGIFRWARGDHPTIRFTPLLGPVLLVSAVSVGRLYRVIHVLQVPLFDSQRVATRLMIVPFVVLVVVAVLNFDWVWNRIGRSWLGLTAGFVGLALLANDLWQHFKAWRVTNLDLVFKVQEVDLSLNVVANRSDPVYLGAISVGLAVTIVTAGFLAYKARREQN